MIDKVGGVIINDKKVLVVRKRTKEDFPEYIIPGGKREKNETDLETLGRELKEEISVNIVSSEYMGKFQDIAIFENEPITITVYLVNVKGEIKVENEIKEYCWIDRNYASQGIKIGSILEKFVIPELISKDLI